VGSRHIGVYTGIEGRGGLFRVPRWGQEIRLVLLLFPPDVGCQTKPDQVNGARARVPLGYLRGYIGKCPTSRAAVLLPVPDRQRVRAVPVQQTNIFLPSVPPGVYRWRRLAAIIWGRARIRSEGIWKTGGPHRTNGGTGQVGAATDARMGPSHSTICACQRGVWGDVHCLSARGGQAKQAAVGTWGAF
jgi:hypothetical protein